MREENWCKKLGSTPGRGTAFGFSYWGIKLRVLKIVTPLCSSKDKSSGQLFKKKLSAPSYILIGISLACIGPMTLTENINQSKESISYPKGQGSRSQIERKH